jgi:hypothetical protein
MDESVPRHPAGELSRMTARTGGTDLRWRGAGLAAGSSIDRVISA